MCLPFSLPPTGRPVDAWLLLILRSIGLCLRLVFLHAVDSISRFSSQTGVYPRRVSDRKGTQKALRAVCKFAAGV